MNFLFLHSYLSWQYSTIQHGTAQLEQNYRKQQVSKEKHFELWIMRTLIYGKLCLGWKFWKYTNLSSKYFSNQIQEDPGPVSD